MKRIILAIASTVMILTMTAVPGKASSTQLSLTLGTSLFDFTLQGTGGSTILFTIRTCDNDHDLCTLASGSASGNNGANLYTSGTYAFTSATSTPLTLTSLGNGNFSVNQTGAINFTYSSPQGTLVGTLSLASVARVYPPPNTAVATGTITLTGGSLMSAVGATSVPISLTFALGGDITSLVGTTGSMTGQVEYPSTMSPVPEPTSMLLLGSGLIALGGVMRRRVRTFIS